MWQRSGALYLPYIFKTHKFVHKPTVDVITKLFGMNSFSQIIVPDYRETTGFS